jgi:hypothetical protein
MMATSTRPVPVGGYTRKNGKFNPPVKRASLIINQPLNGWIAQRSADTDEDTQIAPGIRIDNRSSGKTPSSQWHPIVWVLLTIFAMYFLWWLSTAFWGWIIVHTADALTYGPTHGTTITAVIGGGDSEAQPTTLIAINNRGSVQIIKMLANDPSKAQLLVITDLAAAGVPDPGNAAIELKNQGNTISMTIHTTVWDAPLRRVEQTFVLKKEGQGNLKLWHR